MPTVTIRPNATSSNTAGAVAVGGAGTIHGNTSDNSDVSYVRLTGGGVSNSFIVDMATVAPPAGAAYKSARFYMRDRGANGGGFQAGASLAVWSTSVFGTTIINAAGVSPASPTTWEQLDSGLITVAFTQADVDGLQLNAIQNNFSFSVEVSDIWADITYANAPSAPTGLGPTGTQTNRKPTVTWTHVGGTDAGSGQTYFQVKIYTAAEYGAGGFDPNTTPATQDTGAANSAAQSWAISGNLLNGTSYRAYVRTWQTTNGVNQVSPWSFTSFNVTLTTPVPTAVTPSSGSTWTTSKPAVGATIDPMSDFTLVRRQWQVASNSGFTTLLQTVDTDEFGTSKSGTLAWPATLTRLAQGTWWVRCRTLDQFGGSSAYTTGTSFVVTHVPTTSDRLPTGGISFSYATSVAVSWTFSDIDTEDFQAKYEAELWKLSNPAGSLKTTGQVASAVNTATFTGLDTTWKDTELRWRVRVADQDNVFSAWSVDQAFFLRDLPVSTITSPATGAVITSSSPTVTWTFSAAGGRTQASYRVIVKNTSSNVQVADSGELVGTATTWQVPSRAIVVGPNYSVQVLLTDSSSLVGTDTNTFTASYVAPATPSFVLRGGDFESSGLVTLDWSPSVADASIVAWRIYRRIWGYNTWDLVAEVSPLLRQYLDYTCPSQTKVQYSVVQVAISVGDPIESAYPIVEFQGVCTGYFIVVPENDDYNLKLEHVTGESFEDEQEMATLNLIGRGRRVEYGTRYGQTGTLDGAFYDTPDMTARAQRLFLEAIRDSGLKAYLRNPFGDVWAVAMLSASLTRIAGTGLLERTTYSISYTEITA